MKKGGGKVIRKSDVKEQQASVKIGQEKEEWESRERKGMGEEEV